jgi:hypothetical protein
VTTPAVDGKVQKSFRTHAHYLRALTQLAGYELFPTKDNAATEKLGLQVAAAFPAAIPPRTADIAELSKSLNRAWVAELVLAVSVSMFDEDELIRASNAWGSVQTYYVGYSATQALIIAEGRDRPADHARTQREVLALWVTRAKSVAPFSFAAAAGSRSNPSAYKNGPGRPIDRQMSSLSNVGRSNAWDIAATALRTTRNDAVNKKLVTLRETKARDQKKDWESEENARLAAGKRARKVPNFPKAGKLAPAESSAAEAKVREYTWLDYLYRLRVKANYEEAGMFIDGPDTEHVSGIVALDMVRMAKAIMIAHEVRIGQLLGNAVVMDLATDWASKHSHVGAVGICSRLEMLDRIL